MGLLGSATISRSLLHLKNIQDIFHKKSKCSFLDCLKTLLFLVPLDLALEGWYVVKRHAADINKCHTAKHHDNHQVASAFKS